MKKTMLIIGANSALAQVTIPVLKADNIVITAGKKDCDVYCDVTESVTVPDNVEVIINFAASFGGKSDEEVMNAQKTNVQGTLNVCIAAKNAGVKHIILISSIFADLHKESPFYSVYALTKMQADELATYYCETNAIQLTVLRPSQIYGDSDSFAKNQPFFYQIVNKAEIGEDISLFGNHDALRNYIHSADLAQIISRVIAAGVVGVYSCTYPEDVTYSRIAMAAQKAFNKGGELVYINDKPDVPDNVFNNKTTLYEKLKYFPEVSIEVGMKRIRDYRERKAI
jgi:nucleoside-diphosphate-sugar epimerase